MYIYRKKNIGNEPNKTLLKFHPDKKNDIN